MEVIFRQLCNTDICINFLTKKRLFKTEQLVHSLSFFFTQTFYREVGVYFGFQSVFGATKMGQNSFLYCNLSKNICFKILQEIKCIVQIKKKRCLAVIISSESNNQIFNSEQPNIFYCGITKRHTASSMSTVIVSVARGQLLLMYTVSRHGGSQTCQSSQTVIIQIKSFVLRRGVF